MVDLTFNKKDRKKFIVSYSIDEHYIIARYADGSYRSFPKDQSALDEIECMMREQAVDPTLLNNINKKIKIANLEMAGLTTCAMAASIATCGFVIVKDPTLFACSSAIAVGGAFGDLLLAKKKKKLLELKEYAKKYKLVAENLDSFNRSFNSEGYVRNMTMNDADSFDYNTTKRLVRMVDMRKD